MNKTNTTLCLTILLLSSIIANAAGQCTGTVTPCTTFDADEDVTSCKAQLGCSGSCNNTPDGPVCSCSGIAQPCSTLTESQCKTQQGCTWETESTPTPTATPTPAPTPTATPSETPEPTIAPTQPPAPTITFIPEPTPQPTSTPATQPTKTPTPKPAKTPTPTPMPTATPTAVQQNTPLPPTPKIESECSIIGCSEFKPYYCQNQKWIKDCAKCSCPAGYECSQTSNECKEKQPSQAPSITVTQILDFTLPLLLLVFVIIAIFLVNSLKNHFKEQNTLTEQQRFELAKRNRMLKDLKVDYYKRHITEEEYKKSALQIQAEIKELQKKKENPKQRKKTEKEIDKKIQEIKKKREKGTPL